MKPLIHFLSWLLANNAAAGELFCLEKLVRGCRSSSSSWEEEEGDLDMLITQKMLPATSNSTRKTTKNAVHVLLNK